VERDMRKHFPDLLKDEEARKEPPALAKPQRQASTAPREKGYSTLPPAARKACDDWVSAMKEQGNTWATRETWAATYYEDATNG
jgi:hypothetical protein